MMHLYNNSWKGLVDWSTDKNMYRELQQLLDSGLRISVATDLSDSIIGNNLKWGNKSLHLIVYNFYVVQVKVHR